MNDTFRTQDEITSQQLIESYQQRALELMKEARQDGVILRMDMWTDKQVQKHPAVDTLVVAPNSGRKGPTLLYPAPSATGQKYEV